MLLENSRALFGLWREEAEKSEIFHVEWTDGKRSRQGRRARDWHHFDAHFRHQFEQLFARVGKNRRAAVRDKRHIPAVHQFDQNLLDHVSFVMLI